MDGNSSLAIRNIGDGTSSVIAADTWEALELLEQAEEEGACSWAFHERWRGEPDLVAHVARVARRSLQEPSQGVPRCTITVNVGRDAEVFGSPSKFQNELTESALARFDLVHINVSDETRRVQVLIVRKTTWRLVGWPKGILIKVTGTTERAKDLRPIRDRVLAAIERGVPSRYHPLDGGIGSHEVRSPAEVLPQRRKRAMLAGAITVALLGGISILCSIKLLTSGTSDWLPLWAAIAVLLCSIAAIVVFPRVEISRRMRMHKMVSVVVFILGPIVGAALAIGAEEIADRLDDDESRSEGVDDLDVWASTNA